MLVVMTINAQQLPVAAVQRIIVMIVIAVMNCQFSDIITGEFARTTTANPRIHLQCSLAVTLGSFLAVATSLGNDSV